MKNVGVAAHRKPSPKVLLEKKRISAADSAAAVAAAAAASTTVAAASASGSPKADKRVQMVDLLAMFDTEEMLAL